MPVMFQDPDMQEIFEGFIVETQELLDVLQQDLMSMEERPEDMDLLNSIFRNFHTIKGTSSFMGFDQIAKITHKAEDLLNKIRKNELPVTNETVDVLLDVQDIIQRLMNNIVNEDDSEIDTLKTERELILLNEGKSIAENEAHLQNTPTADNILEDNDTQKIIEQSDDPILNVLNDTSFGKHDGDFTDEELEALQAAFSKINDELHQQSPKVEPDSDESNQEISFGDDPVAYVINDKSFGKHDGDFTEEELAALQEAFAKVNDEIHSQSQINIDSDDPFINPDFLPTETIEDVTDQSSEDTSVVLEDKKVIVETIIEEPKLVIEESIPTPSKPIIASEKQEEKKSVSAVKASETIRIDVSRIETLMDLSGELVLGRNRLAQITAALENDSHKLEQVRDLIESTLNIDFLTSEIQSAVMKMRMVQIGKLYQKAPRIVRDLAKEFKKKIKLEVKGEETEIDRGIIEELNDPLVHMIRNSCDHGIESPEVRLSKGKNENGTIVLDADQEGNNIVMRISDDGAGMDAERLKSKAVERGVITQDHANQMSDREAFQLIFAPGFSMAKVVTSVSGRGVGMDVVRTHIEKLKGIIEIDSKIDVGTTFVIKLPLTLAIIQGLLVRVSNEIFAIPLSSVIEVVSIDTDNVYYINQQEVIRIRTEVLPITRLDKALQLNESKLELKDRYVVNVGVGVQNLGIVVDELIGQEEIVIKSLGKYLGNIRGIAGSTILGDGRPIMILDISQMVQMILNNRY